MTADLFVFDTERSYWFCRNCGIAREVHGGCGRCKPLKLIVAAPTAAVTMRMRRFRLVRDVDETGTSGVGIVAEGCEFSSGMCALTWLSPYQTVSMWASIKAVEIVHGHSGKTRVVWIDPVLL